MLYHDAHVTAGRGGRRKGKEGASGAAKQALSLATFSASHQPHGARSSAPASTLACLRQSAVRVIATTTTPLPTARPCCTNYPLPHATNAIRAQRSTCTAHHPRDLPLRAFPLLPVRRNPPVSDTATVSSHLREAVCPPHCNGRVRATARSHIPPTDR